MSAMHRSGDENSSCADSASEPVRRTERIRRLTKHTLAESSDDSSDSEGVPGQLTRFQSTCGIKLSAAEFSLTDEEHMVVCPKDLREGIITDRYLAPAITRFAIKVGNQEGHDLTQRKENFAKKS
jgi:hypothetical protein